MSSYGYLCGSPSYKQGLDVSRYLCPWCQGIGAWEGGERCQECHGTGQVNDPTHGVDLSGQTDYARADLPEDHETPALLLPRPPAVMKAPCVDCAFRPGSPEEDLLERRTDTPFYCHHGLTRVDNPHSEATGYLAPVYLDGMPVGAMVCAGWWQSAIFRDPGGADRPESIPEVEEQTA